MIEIKPTIKGKLLEDFLKSYGHNLNSVRDEILNKLKKDLAITTHGGKYFHQDETLAIALLFVVADKVCNIDPRKITIIRTRNEEEFSGVILDVGMNYLDHHMQNEMCAYREDGTKYASAGLLWAYMGNLLISDRFIKNIDNKLFKPSDMTDNGEGSSSASFADMMNPIDENDNLMENFMEVVFHYKKCIERVLKEYKYIESLGDITPFIKEGEKSGIMILKKYIPWEEEAPDSKVNFVVWENEDKTSEDKYKAQVVPIRPNSFIAKVPFPETFNGVNILGKRSDFFKHIDEISGLTFVHPARFFICSKDLESILNLINSIKKEGGAKFES